jgi:hypothetical protein
MKMTWPRSHGGYGTNLETACPLATSSASLSGEKSEGAAFLVQYFTGHERFSSRSDSMWRPSAVWPLLTYDNRMNATSDKRRLLMNDFIFFRR